MKTLAESGDFGILKSDEAPVEASAPSNNNHKVTYD